MLQLSIMQWLFLLLILALNVISFILFYQDKKRAQQRRYRIPERRLLLSAFLLGGVGAWCGMKLFRHKTKHNRFKLGIPVAAVITTVVALTLIS